MGLKFLESKILTYVLIFGILTSSIVAAFIGYKTPFNDAEYYLALADSLLHGEYSPWWIIDIDVPDTLRTFGYPMILAPFRALSKSLVPIHIFQYLLYAGAVILVGLIAFDFGRIALNIFLFLVAFNVQVPFYIGQIASEIPTVFLVSLALWIQYKTDYSSKKILVLGLIFGLIFLYKPVFLLFPLVYAIYIWRQEKARQAVMFCFAFFLVILPYAFWNLHNHGVLKLTPLEGGMGVMHAGFWQHKLPGYQDYHYWQHYMGEELFSFSCKEDLPDNIKEYNEEWDRIYKQAEPFLQPADSSRLEIMASSGIKMFKVYSTEYTIARESALRASFISSVFREPWYYTKTRLYTMVRLRITGVDLKKVAAGGKEVLMGILPFIITFLSFGFGFLFLISELMKKNIKIEDHFLALALIVYFGFIHIPFSIQSRYSIPVHLVVFLIISIQLGKFFPSRKRSRD